MSSKLRIGVIGGGVLGTYHLDKCLKNSSVACSGCFDLDPDQRTKLAARFGTVVSSDQSTLIAQSDALIIATPCSSHNDVAQACVAAGKHIFIEKPLARSYAEGLTIVNAARDKGLVVRVGHSEFYNPAFTFLLSQSPRPKFIEIHRLAEFSPRGTDVPVVLDLMVHDVQLLLRLCQEEPVYKTIMATGVSVISGDVDIANIRLAFPSGCVANLTASRISTKKMRKLRLFQKDNYFSADLGTGVVECYHYDHDAQAQGKWPIGFVQNSCQPIDALEAEQADFYAAIAGQQTNGVCGTEALTVLKITDAIIDQLSKSS